MLLQDLVETSAAVAETRSRKAKVERIAALLGRLPPGEAAVAVSYLAGELRQRQTGVGWASLRDLPPPAPAPALTVAEVDAAFARIAALAGPGSQRERRRLLADLFARATEAESRFLRGLALGDLRQGALEGVMADAVAAAAGVPLAEVRRAAMLRGDLPAVAEIALAEGAAGLRAVGLEVGRPVQPMLATPGDGVEDALGRTGPAAIEWKLDGARIQVHRRGDDVSVFTRSLDDISDRVPEVVAAARALPVTAAVLDGEVIALRADGRPQPFQVTASRLGSRRDLDRLRESIPLTPVVFDALHLDGTDLIDRPGGERFAALAEAVPESLRITRRPVTGADDADAFMREAIARGHEGVMLKSLAAPYAAGSRGAGWVKLKPRHTLDLVVLAAEWGHGRRRGWLSNLHLGARDPESGGFVMLGKTFKGLTDAMLAWQTDALLALAEERGEWVVRVRPELVVEIAFDGVQTSSRYQGGVALRFARVLRHRPDKAAAEADTLAAVLAIHAASGAA